MDELLSHTDEEIGRFVRKMLVKTKGDQRMVAFATGIFIQEALSSNAEYIKSRMNGFEHKGEPFGDWELTLRKVTRTRKFFNKAIDFFANLWYGSYHNEEALEIINDPNAKISHIAISNNDPYGKNKDAPKGSVTVRKL